MFSFERTLDFGSFPQKIKDTAHSLFSFLHPFPTCEALTFDLSKDSTSFVTLTLGLIVDFGSLGPLLWIYMLRTHT